MSCPHCIGIEEMFDLKGARKEMRRYQRKGPRSSTKKLLQLLQQVNPKGSLLDIGSGIGALPLSLMKEGITNTVTVDASGGYREVAREEAARQGMADRLTQLGGDFIDLADQVETADVVTLDKVLCCYPDADRLLQLSANRARQYYAIVLPHDTRFARLVNKVAHLFLRIKGSPFRTFIHPVAQLESKILDAGFKPRAIDRTSAWSIRLYERIEK